MGLLDGVIGGVVGAAATQFINSHGGVQGIVSQMQQHGLGDTVKSWVATGPNQPITADQLHQVFGAGTLAEIAQRVGMNPQELQAKLAQVLPQAIDHMTPNGAVPPQQPA